MIGSSAFALPRLRPEPRQPAGDRPGQGPAGAELRRLAVPDQGPAHACPLSSTRGRAGRRSWSSCGSRRPTPPWCWMNTARWSASSPSTTSSRPCWAACPRPSERRRAPLGRAAPTARWLLDGRFPLDEFRDLFDLAQTARGRLPHPRRPGRDPARPHPADRRELRMPRASTSRSSTWTPTASTACWCPGVPRRSEPTSSRSESISAERRLACASRPALITPPCMTARNRDAILEQGDVGQDVALDDQQVGELAGLDRADLRSRGP